jgi:pimeloyl-ACP methyl ester carboxylesterase
VPTFAELNFVYAPLADQLASTNRTLMFNPHVSTTETFGPAARAKELGNVLDILGIRTQIHIVSWSDAGMGAHVFGELWPQRVLSCTYIGMPDRYVLPSGLRRLSHQFASGSLHRATPPAVSAFVIAALMGSVKMPTRDLFGEILTLGPVSAYLKYSVLPCLLHELTGKPSHPTLVLGGDCDRFVTLDQMKSLAQRLDATFVHVPGGDHFLPWTSPQTVNTTVVAFVNATN